MFDNKKVYGPYTRKDGRQIVVLKTPGSFCDHETISYPKYLVECALNMKLPDGYTIDHIDGDFTNNDFHNLRIVKLSEHARSHVTHRKEITKTCCICGKQFKTSQKNRKTCGSKSCAGRCSHILGYNKGNNFSSDDPEFEFYDGRDDLSNYSTVAELIANKVQ